MKTNAKVPIAVTERSQQNLSQTFFGSHDFGRMDVVYCNEDIVPGDDVYLKIDGFMRGAMMPAPTFGDVDVDIRVFFVPHRILTSRQTNSQNGDFSWDDFIGGNSSTSHPYMDFTSLLMRINKYVDYESNYVGDYLHKDLRRLYSQLGYPESVYNATLSSIPSVATAIQRINPWKFAAYQRIWWDWYRDSSLIPESFLSNYLPIIPAGQIPQSLANQLCTVRYACWRKDMFNVAKLKPQQGAASASAVSASSSWTINDVTFDSQNVLLDSGVLVAPSLTQMNTVPIQWIRAANSLQKYLERNNLAGTRLMERFLARFGVAPSPLTLDMSEYLGGSRSTLKIGDVTNNTPSDLNGQPSNAFNTSSGYQGQGTDGGIMGQTAGKCAADCHSGSISFHAKEFGTLMAIQTIIPHIHYVQGLHRENTRGTYNDRFDYFTPEMENLGYEPIFQRELYAADTSQLYNIFGFTPRYSSYKNRLDVVSGDLVLADTSAGMDAWHLARMFGLGDLDTNGRLLLTPAFTQITPYARLALDRIFTIPGSHICELDHFTSVIHADVKMSRPMSASNLPSLDEDLGEHGKTVTIQNGGVRL